MPYNGLKRRLIELAVECGRDLQSEQTGFIHYHHHFKDANHFDAIPVYENVLFSLALLKTCKSENIQEAKRLLERLIHYQSKESGNFPNYLHEYPICYSRFAAVKLLSPFSQILEHFKNVLGRDLAEEIITCLDQLSSYCLFAIESKPTDYLTTLSLLSGVVASKSILGQPNTNYLQRLEDLSVLGPDPIWFSRQGIGEIYRSLALVYSSIGDSPWKRFWDHLESSWHPGLKSYSGPALDEWLRGGLPEPLVYDYILASHSGSLPERLLPKNLSQLEMIAVKKTEDELNVNHVPDSYTVTGQSQAKKGFHPFYFQWEHAGRLCSLSCSGGHIGKVTYTQRRDGVDLYFYLPEEVKSDHPLENRELLFFFSRQEGIKTLIENQSATTFQLGETVQIHSDCNISLRFQLKSGEGDFMGHFMPGNRPAQRLESEVYDWQVFLRTIRKKTPCEIHVEVFFEC